MAFAKRGNSFQFPKPNFDIITSRERAVGVVDGNSQRQASSGLTIDGDVGSDTGIGKQDHQEGKSEETSG